MSLYPTSLSYQNSQADSRKICLDKLYLFPHSFSICFLMDHFPFMLNNIAKGLQSRAYFLEINSVCNKLPNMAFVRTSPIYEKDQLCL